MDDRLEKSLSLLEDITRGIPSHGKLLRLQETGYNRDSSIASASLMFNNSLTFAQKRKSSRFKKSDLNNLSFSIAIDQSEMSALLDQTATTRFIGQEIVTLNQLFQEVFEMHGNSQSIFDAILNFIEVLNKTISMETAVKDASCVEIAALLNERNTWLLIHALYKDREMGRSMDSSLAPDTAPESLSSPNSEKEIMDNLYQLDSSIRECQIVVDWLERVAREDCGDSAKVPHFTDPTVAWENTLHEIHNSSLAYASTRQLVLSLDPDAPARENKYLHDVDHEDQYRLLTEVLKEIRMGRLDKAQELCLHCGQAWLAAALEGWRLYHDPNRDASKVSGGTIADAEGNEVRDIWKWVAWNICQGDHADSHDALEKAIYGSLCGHLDALRPICTSWEDQLWAYTRTAIDVRVEKQIRENITKQYEPLPSKYWNSYYTLEEIFNKLKATHDLKSEANSIVRIIQELVCLDRPAALIQTMSAHVDNADRFELSSDTLRFMAHVVLVLRMIGRSYPDQHANNIIRAYVKVLSREADPNLVAFYTSKLQPEDQIEQYALFLEPIADVDKKLLCLQVASGQELNVPAITHRVAQIIWIKSMNNEDDEGLTKETTDVDLMKIDALDWMIFYKEQRCDALCETNNIVRNFIFQSKIDAARRAHNKMPEDSIDLIMSRYDCRVDDRGCLQTDSLPPSINSAVTEYLAYKAYLDAQEGFSDWFKMFHSRPSKGKVDNLDDLTDFAKQVSLRENARVLNEKYESWKATIDHVTKTVKAQLYNVLVFPPKGWLVDIFSDESNVQRKTQLNALRSVCIPEIIVLLHTVLHSMELYEDCLDLCSVIMSEQHLIYKVLSKQGLKDLLEKLSNSCLELSCVAADAFALAPPVEPARPLQISL